MDRSAVNRVFQFLTDVTRYETRVSYERGGVHDVHSGTVVTETDSLHKRLLQQQRGRWHGLGVAVEGRERWISSEQGLQWQRAVVPGVEEEDLFCFDLNLRAVKGYLCGDDCYTAWLQWQQNHLISVVRVEGPKKDGWIKTQYFQ